MKKIIYLLSLIIFLLPTNMALAISAPTFTVYRFWSNTYRGHFYTADASEASYVDANYPEDVWKSEGEQFDVYNPEICFSAPPGACLPVYRFWSDQYRHHFYTISESEKTNIMNKMPEWKYEGVAYAAATAPAMGPASAPLYRFWSDTYKAHFYTISEVEKNNVLLSMPEWKYEGVAYYVINPDMVFPT
jgi:hypothetical protein